jgi:hypothetical protein
MRKGKESATVESMIDVVSVLATLLRAAGPIFAGRIA